MVPKTEFLNTYSLKLNDTDYKNIITFSLINNKIYQAYVYNLKNLRSLNISNQQIDIHKFQSEFFPGQDAKLEDVLEGLSKRIPGLIQNAITFLSQVPGFSELSNELICKLIKRNLEDYFLITHCQYFVNGQSYIFLDNGIQVTRQWLEKVRGKEKTDFKFNTAESLRKLDLTEREKALFIVLLFSNPGIKCSIIYFLI